MNVIDLFRNVKYPIQLYNKDGKLIYNENSDGFWFKKEYNDNGYEIYHETSKGYWYRRDVTSDGRQTYYYNSNNIWSKKEYNGEEIIYCETSIGGVLFDFRPKEMTVSEISKELGYEVKIIK